MVSQSSSFLSSKSQTMIPNIHIQHSLSLPQIHFPSVRLENKLRQASMNSSQIATTSSTLPTTPKIEKSTLPPSDPNIKSINKSKTQPSPPSKYSLLSTFLDTIDDIINTCIDPPNQPSIDPRFVLSNNFAPVDELPPTECEIEEGALPSCLDGAYIRNGPNPQFPPRGPYHLFDGDGMLHSIHISHGKATLCSRHVKTHKFVIEHKVGSTIFPNLFSGFNNRVGFVARGLLAVARVIVGQFNPSNGIGSANTSLAFFGNKLYALCEGDLPYEVRFSPNGDIETVGRSDFNGELRMRMTAHPKVDPMTGEAFAFCNGLMHPFLTFFRFDSKGNKQEDVPIFSMRSPSLLHDFGITKKYAVFPEIQIQMNLAEMIIRGGSFAGFDPTKISRFGVIPRYAKDERAMKWFEAPGVNMLHVINAWDEVDEDGNEVIVVLAPNIISAEHTLERVHLTHSLVEMIKINLDNGVVIRQPLSARNLDWGVINLNYVGKKNKYVYAGVGDPSPKLAGVVKLDVSIVEDRRDCIVASRMFGPGCFGSEPFFVASSPDDADADEDEGYLLSYVHNENTQESRFIVMDAKSPGLDVVASVKLPQRVPYGFHGLFVKDADLKGL